MRRGPVRSLVVVTALGVAAAGLAGPASAKPSDLDPGFGTAGQAVVVGPDDEYGYKVALQKDGGIIGVGFSNGGTKDRGIVFRLTPGGKRDAAFGLRYLDQAAVNEAYGVTVQADGKIVVVGAVHNATKDAAVWRLLPTGAPDPSFGGGDGYIAIDSGGNEEGADVAVQADGKIVVVGVTSVGGGEIVVYRRLANGDPDNAFDQDGAIGFGGPASDDGRAVAVQPDGKILVTGYVANVEGVTVYRLKTDGSPDDTFDQNGSMLVPGTVSKGSDLALQKDGKILVSTAVDNGTDADATVVRITKQGTVDTTFGGSRGTSVDLGNDEGFSSVAVGVNGQVIAAGGTDAGQDGIVVRFTATGQRDPAFGTSGVKRLTSMQYVDGMAVQPDGKVVLISNDGASRSNPLLFRLLGSYVTPTCFGKKATIVGTPGNDRIPGTSRADVIVGLGGNDRINGLGGNDLICGGDGNDTLIGGTGTDRISGGAGADTVS